jgi:hypothetical protein
MNRRYRRWLVGVTIAISTIAPARAWANAPGAVPTCPADRRVEDRQSGPPTLCVTDNHVYREGAFVVVDALLRNVSTKPIAHAEVEVAFYTDSGHLVAVQDSVLRPDRLEPGQEGSELVVTPYQNGIDKIRYRVTWLQAGRQYQGAAGHMIALG